MKQWIINFLLRKVVKVVILEDVIRVDKGKVYLGNLVLTDSEKKSIQAEAKALQGMRIWSIINETVKQLCYERGWRDSKTLEELNVAKSMYHILDVQNSIIDKVKEVV